jgi:hypothetical protein
VKTLLLALVTAGLFAASGLVAASENRPNNSREMPACEEDASIIGTGDFVAGRWSAYVCGPSVDDYTSGATR